MAANSYGTGKARTFNDVYISVVDCGVANKETDMSFVRSGTVTGTSCYGIVFVQKGGISAVIRDRDVAVDEGGMILYYPGELRSMVSAGTSLLRYAVFTGYAIPEILTQCGFPESGAYMVSDPRAVSDTMARLMLARERSSSETRMNSLLLHLLSELSPADGSHTHDTPSDVSCLEKIFRARKLMDAEYRNARKISEYAGLCSMSLGRFSAVFEKAVGKTPKRYIEDMKIDRACELLLHTAMTVTAAAQSSGFSDSLYFSRVFRKKFGMSPTEYREMSYSTSDTADSL